MKKRFLAMLLALVMMLSLVPVTALAETDANELDTEAEDYVAWIDDTEYETLDEAVAAAQADDMIEITEAGTYTLPDIPNNITITGATDVDVVFDCAGSGSICSIPNGATFENVKFEFGQSSYHGFQHAGTINMTGCELNGLLFSYGNMNFDGCTFNAPGTEYSMWCYAGDVTYKDCIVNCAGKFANVYNEGNDGGTPWNITATGCEFNSTKSNKAAFNVKETCGTKMLKYNVSISNCTCNENFPAASESDTLIVFNGLVQVDDRKASVESGITVTLDGTQVYPEKEPTVVVVDPEDPTKTASVTTEATSHVVADVVEQLSVDNDVKNAVTNTKVTGVQLTEPETAEATVSGLQQVIEAAKAKNADVKSAIEADGEKTINVKVDVEVTPEMKKDTGVISFKLIPFATVTVGEDSATVPVDNTMIDAKQDIEVSIYTGYAPSAIMHDDDNGSRIETFTGDQIVYDEATGFSTVTIHHFSSLTPTKVGTVAMIDSAEYATLDDAFAALNGGSTANKKTGTIVLLQDITTEKQITISFQDTILDLNGHTITDSCNADNFKMSGSSSLTLKDSVGGGKFKSERSLPFAVGQDCTLSIEGGTYTKSAEQSEFASFKNGATLSINGGTFNFDPTKCSVQLLFGDHDAKETDCVPEEGYTVTDNEDGTWTVEKVKTNVAQIGETGYETLQAAFDAATAGQIVQLIADVDITTGGLTVAEGKDIVLDLNGHNIKAGEQHSNNIQVVGKLTLVDSVEASTGKIYTEEEYTSTANKGVIFVSGEFVMNSGKIEACIESDPVNKGQFGVALNHDCKVTINGGEIKAGWQTLVTNGSEGRGNTEIVVNGGTLISTNDYAISNPAKNSKVTVTGGTIYGATGGIAMIQGTLNVTGGTITSKGQGSTGTWGDGTGNLGNAAISIGKDATGYGNVTATISGGKISAVGNAVVINKIDSQYGYNLSLALTGGYYTSDVTAYVAPGYECISTPDGEERTAGYLYTIGEKKVAKIGDVTYPSLAAAIAAATDGTQTTIVMIDNEAIDVATAPITIPANKNVVLDLNGFQVVGHCSSGTTSAMITNKGTLTVMDSTDTDKNGTGNGMIVAGADPTWKYDDESGSFAGSYASNAIRNEGAIYVVSGLINNVSSNGSAAYAIDNYNSGIVNVSGGALETAFAAAIRMFYGAGSLNISGGVLTSGQRNAVQVMGGSSVTTITGGKFNGATGYGGFTTYYGDTAKVSISGGEFNGTSYLYNLKDDVSAELVSITGGKFDTFVSYNNGNFITGGYYKQSVSTLVAPGYQCINTPENDPNHTAYPYTIGVAPVAPEVNEQEVQTDSQTNVPEGAETGLAEKVVEEVIKEITENTAVSADDATNIQTEEVQTALKKVDTLKDLVDSTSQLKITVKSVASKTTETTIDTISATTVTTTSAKYDVKPYVTIETIDGQGQKTTVTRVISNDELTEAGVSIKFRLAVPESMKGEAVQVKHYNNNTGTGDPDWTKTYVVQGGGDNRYVELEANSFSIYELVEKDTQDYVALHEGGQLYKTLKEALAAAAASATSLKEPQTVFLVNDSNEPEANQMVDTGVTLDLRSHNITAYTVAVFGKMIDTQRTENKKQVHGKIFVASNHLMYGYGANEGNCDDATLPVWQPAAGGSDEDGYILCQVRKFYSHWSINTPYKYMFAPDGEESDLPDLKAILGPASKVNMYIQVNYTVNGKDTQATFSVSPALMEALAAAPLSNCITLKLNVTNGITNIRASGYLEAEQCSGYKIGCNKLVYSGPTNSGTTDQTT